MKETKEQLAQRVKSITSTCDFLVNFVVILAIVIAVGGIALGNMDSKFNEQKTTIRNYEAKLNYYFDSKEKERETKRLEERCSKIADISGKPFKVVNEFVSSKPACNYRDIFMYSVKQIEDAILHYQLMEIQK